MYTLFKRLVVSRFRQFAEAHIVQEDPCTSEMETWRREDLVQWKGGRMEVATDSLDTSKDVLVEEG